MVFAFAPIVGLLLGLSAITVPWETLVLSVVALHRRAGDRGADRAATRAGTRRRRRRWRTCWRRCNPLSLVALLATLVLLFGFQGEQIIAAAADHR